MRTPTPLDQQMSWWRAALEGQPTPITGDEQWLLPQPGYYKIRAKAWSKTWLPARVWLQQEIDWTTGELLEPETPVVEVADGEVSAAPPWDTKASLKLRLLRAQQEAETLTLDATIKGTSKSGNDFSYKGISQAQVVARAKSVLIKHGVLYTAEPDLSTVKVNGNKTSLVVVGTFESVDNDEVKTVRMLGEGTDNADNGPAKAFTSGSKQILLKQLNLTTVEDEKHTEVEHETTPRTTAVRAAEATTEAAVKTWGDAYRAALRGCTSLADLKRIRAENSTMMQKVPEATRDYFQDMIASLEGSLT